MRILTTDNKSYDLSLVPDSDEDLCFCVLDNSVPSEVDFFFNPLLFLECFSSPALVMTINGNRITMPIDWQVLIGEVESGDMEAVPLSSINGRDFKAFTTNPISGFRPAFENIDVIDVYPDVKWFFPKLKPGQYLAVPLEDNADKPVCAFFIKETTKNSEVVEYSSVW